MGSAGYGEDSYFAPFCLAATEELLGSFRGRPSDGLTETEKSLFDQGWFVASPTLLLGAADLQVAEVFGMTVWVYRETQPSPVWRGSPKRIVGEAPPLWRYEVVGEMKGSALSESVAKAWAERCAIERSGRARPERSAFHYSISRQAELSHEAALRAANDRIMQEFPVVMEPELVEALAAKHAAWRHRNSERWPPDDRPEIESPESAMEANAVERGSAADEPISWFADGQEVVSPAL